MKNLLPLLIAMLFFACSKDTEQPQPNLPIENYQPIVKNVTASLTGIIVDENNTPLADANVTLDNSIFQTDEYGHFFINDITMNSRGASIQVDKDGFFPGSRRFFPMAGKENRVKVMLIPKVFDKDFNASIGATVSTNGGASVEFESDVIASMDGAPYSGSVKVATKWLDPTLAETFDQMPGNLQGVDQLNQEVALATYGMIAVELEDENGNPLNIAEGRTATIKLPIPTSLLENAPNEIPLWSYNEELSIWVEESVATLVNDHYVGEVSHFSFWNCDAPFPLIQITMQLNDSRGNGLKNVQVKINMDNGSSTGSGYTDTNGNLSGLIPKDEILTMELCDPCGNIYYSQEIGPFSMDTDLGTITANAVIANNTSISGTLECDGIPISNGIVKASFGNQDIYEYITDGTFSFSFTTCESTNDIEVIGINLEEGAQSEAQIVSSDASTDLGSVETCEAALKNYARITIDGQTAYYNFTLFIVDSTESFILISSSNINSDRFGFAFYGNYLGEHNDFPNNQLVSIEHEEYDWDISPSATGFDNLYVTAIGEIGEEITGYFSTVLDGQQIEGDFSITRTE